MAKKQALPVKPIVEAEDALFLDPIEVQTLRNNWVNYSLDSIYQLFLPPESLTGKVIGFMIDNTDLASFFPTGNPIAGSEIIFYMGADLNAGPGQPQFAPIAQLLLPGEDPFAYNRCLKLNWKSDVVLPNAANASFVSPDGSNLKGIIVRKGAASRIVKDFPINTSLVWDFVSRWYLSSVNRNLFYSDLYGARLAFYTFNANDTNMIWNAFINRTTNKDTDGLLMYCGVNMNINQNEPFPFRIILWMNQQTLISEPQFFEFANPCPPFCKEEE
ncbi:MAG: hypothetical protein AAFP19_22370 [Bacteroidota bacterium]